MILARDTFTRRPVKLGANLEHIFNFAEVQRISMYLEEHAIQSTLRAVSTLPAGSRTAFDFLSREWLEKTRAGKTARLGVKATYGEPFMFGFPVTPDFSGQMKNYLEERGLALECDRPLGDEGGGKVPYGGLVLAATPILP